jgi:GntR family carbon starvation induced transcriptional regulator
LVGEGLVTFEGNKGFRVRGLSREDLADIAYMRTAVETFAIRTAVERGGVEWESGIVAALHTLTSLTRDTATDRASLDAWNVAHDRFHEAVISACGSPRVFETQRRLLAKPAVIFSRTNADSSNSGVWLSRRAMQQSSLLTALYLLV